MEVQMKIDFETHRLLTENETIYLTNIQNRILKLFYNNEDKVLKYEILAKEIYGIECDSDLKKLIRKQVSLLNKKVNKYIKIKNIKDVGYIIEEESV